MWSSLQANLQCPNITQLVSQSQPIAARSASNGPKRDTQFVLTTNPRCCRCRTIYGLWHLFRHASPCHAMLMDSSFFAVHRHCNDDPQIKMRYSTHTYVLTNTRLKHTSCLIRIICRLSTCSNCLLQTVFNLQTISSSFLNYTFLSYRPEHWNLYSNVNRWLLSLHRVHPNRKPLKKKEDRERDSSFSFTCQLDPVSRSHRRNANWQTN